MAFKKLLETHFDADTFERELPGLAFSGLTDFLKVYNELNKSFYILEAFEEEAYRNGNEFIPWKYKKCHFHLNSHFHFGNIAGETVRWTVRGIPNQIMRFKKGKNEASKSSCMKENEIETFWRFKLGYDKMEKRVLKTVLIGKDDVYQLFDEYFQDSNGCIHTYHLTARFVKVRRSRRFTPAYSTIPLQWASDIYSEYSLFFGLDQ